MKEAGRTGRLVRAALFFGLLVLMAGWGVPGEQPLVTVGEVDTSNQDVAYRIGVAAAYGQHLGREAAVVSLLRHSLEREVARSVGVLVSNEELAGFSVHVEKASKAPQVLAKVRQAFAGDTAAYRRLYLAPKILNRKLRNWFSRDTVMQKKPRETIRRAYGLAVAGNDFSQVAEVTSLKLAKLTYKAEKQDAPAALQIYFPEGMATMSPGFRKLLDGIKPGEIAGAIAEDDWSFRVVRLVEKRNGTYKTMEIIAAKAPFDPWFRAQAANIRVEIHDEQLRLAILRKYPAMPWLR